VHQHLEAAAHQLDFRAQEISQALASFGVSSRRLGGDEIAQLWSDCLRSDFGLSSATLADRGPVITARNGEERHHD
jgi:hypothetical protein